MTRAQIRAKLRRRLNEEVGDSAGGWTDVELNSEINDAYAWVQKEVYKIFPEAHLFWDYMNSTASTSWYPLPDSFGVSEVGLKAASTDTTFTRLDKKVYEDIKDLTTGYGPYYCLRGQWLGIFPAPSAGVTNGIELVHTPIMTLSADTDVPRVKTPIHEAIVLKAKDSLLGDLDSQSAQNRQSLADYVNDLALWYEKHTDDADRLQVVGL
jgi:hypothetical protein